MASVWTWVVSFLLPDSLLVLAAVGFLRPGGLPNVMLPLEQAFAYLVLAVGILLGLYVRHSRILFAMLLLALADLALLHLAAGAAASTDVGRVMFNAVALLLPLNLLALSLITERSLLISREFARLILVLLQVFFVSWIGLPENVDFAAALESSFIAPRYTAWTPVAQPALVAFGAALALQTVRFTSYRNPVDRGFFWALVSVFLALHGTRAGWSPTNFLATAGLILIIAAYAEIYQSTYYDELTGMRGRPYWDQAVANLGSRYTIALIDLDGMKHLNDAHGYAVGDQILRMVARKVTNLSGDGKAFRYDGNRFAVVFHDKSVTTVLPHLEELRKAVEVALARAKHDGRNQVKARAPAKE
ncbi:MAG: GGDEF domain-containing protein [Nitrospiraceae bacterium]|nr:GGDEF domain-containing protein [Nitrospiraceae bacterium]